MSDRRASIMAPRLLSREQVADYLQCSESTVDNLVEDGLIPGPRPWRGLVRWDKIALDRVIDRVYGLAGDLGEQHSIDEAIDGRPSASKVRRDPPKPGRV
jgi:excisionase family DNA binding protein